MIDRPYEILNCSWPRPISEAGRRWISAPEWNAPPTHLRPEPAWTTMGNEHCWTIDWREVFRGDRLFGGEMRRFHVRFEIRVKQSGKLVFWEDDGSLIRRRGELLHEDREAHAPRRAEIEVDAGDCLEIAQWQFDGGWTWGARLEEAAKADPLGEFRESVCRRLRSPEGPPLKIFCHGREPLRTVLAIYSMILNGYAPAGVLLFGEHQWSPAVRRQFEEALPFARIVSTAQVLETIRTWGGAALAEHAQTFWFVMKSCIGLLCAPAEFCLMDDDVVVVEPVSEGLAAAHQSDFVFAPDLDHEALYLSIWGGIFGLSTICDTAAVNTGLYWMRNPFDPQYAAQRMLAGANHFSREWAWEQGLFAHLFHDRPITRLPSQRYFYPLLDGLPGGIEGYDYAGNPCGFATIHFGGPIHKPGDQTLLPLLPQILRRRSRG
jgi:hypothetical protein